MDLKRSRPSWHAVDWVRVSSPCIHRLGPDRHGGRQTRPPAIVDVRRGLMREILQEFCHAMGHFQSWSQCGQALQWLVLLRFSGTPGFFWFICMFFFSAWTGHFRFYFINVHTYFINCWIKRFVCLAISLCPQCSVWRSSLLLAPRDVWVPHL